MRTRIPLTTRTWRIPAVALALLTFAACSEDGVGPVVDPVEPPLPPVTSSSEVYTYPSELGQLPIDGAIASIVRKANDVQFSVETNSLQPGHAYTLRVVIFNEPGQCPSAPCAPLDLFNPTAKPDMLYGAGVIASASGSATLAGRTQVGDVRGSVQTPVGLPTNGLIDPYGAEIHLVVHHHGPVISVFMPDMIQSLAGGCTDAAILAPGEPSPWNDYALSAAYGGEFGRLGPNACESVQVSILRP